MSHVLDHAIYIASVFAFGALAGATFVGLKWRRAAAKKCPVLLGDT